MKPNKSLVIFGVLALVLSLLTISDVASAAQQGQGKPIKLGVLIDFTGPMSFAGQPVVDGVKMRLEEAGYKVAGRPIQLVVEDSATDASIALEKAKKMVEKRWGLFHNRPDDQWDADGGDSLPGEAEDTHLGDTCRSAGIVKIRQQPDLSFNTHYGFSPGGSSMLPRSLATGRPLASARTTTRDMSISMPWSNSSNRWEERQSRSSGLHSGPWIGLPI